MANKKLSLSPERQYPLTLMKSFTWEHVADASIAVKVASIPADAVITSAVLVSTTGFGATKTLNVGHTGAPTALGAAVDVAAAGIDVLTVTGKPVGATDIIVTPTAAQTAGAATLIVTYVIVDRGNEAQP